MHSIQFGEVIKCSRYTFYSIDMPSYKIPTEEDTL